MLQYDWILNCISQLHTDDIKHIYNKIWKILDMKIIKIFSIYTIEL